MPESISGMNEAVETQEVSKEELASATDVMLSLLKASKGLKMYLPNNPLVARFIEELTGRMSRHLEEYGDFRLEIDQFELRYRGKAVYENREPKESVAFKMYFDGIRYLIFSEGIEEHELCDFLDIVGKERPGDVDDDIVTLLWEKNLPHLTYILAEDFLEFDTAIGPVTSPRSQQDKISGMYKTISEAAPPPPISLIPQNILLLTEEETEWLKKAREADEKRRPLDEVIQILTAILIGEKDQELLREFVDIMAKLTENLFISGEIRYALNLTRFLASLAKNEQIPPEKRALIAGALETLFSREAAEALAGSINTTDLVNPEELMEFLRLFGKPTITNCCDLLGLVENAAMRKAIIQVLIELGQDSPEVFFPYLSDSRWYIVRNIAFILSRIGDPRALDAVVSIISHKEPRVRKEVLNCLAMTPDPRAKTYVLKFLRDSSSALRIRALQVLARSKSNFALKPIIAMASSDQFHEKETDEKKAVFEAIGELGGDQMLPMFSEMIMKKYWFNKAKEKETALCAVAGLVKIRSEGALRLLEDARNLKSDESREIIAQAIEVLSSENLKGSAGS
jgi:HEAT repeat protein